MQLRKDLFRMRSAQIPPPRPTQCNSLKLCTLHSTHKNCIMGIPTLAAGSAAPVSGGRREGAARPPQEAGEAAVRRACDEKHATTGRRIGKQRLYARSPAGGAGTVSGTVSRAASDAVSGATSDTVSRAMSGSTSDTASEAVTGMPCCAAVCGRPSSNSAIRRSGSEHET